jgi:DNA-binding protein H-NS
MNEYQEILQQIRELQARADSLRLRERAEAILKVQDLVDVYAIKRSEIKFFAEKLAPSSKKDGRSKVAIRFSDKKGNEWSGRGKKPRWIIEALASGETTESLRHTP